MFNHYIIQASTQQDFCTSGEDYLVVADCHGSRENKDVLLEYMRNYNWKLKLNTNWIPEVLEKTSKEAHAGATLTVFKIYPDRFECFWIGDSPGKIYSGDKLIFETKNHDYNHEEDLKRIKTYQHRTDIQVKDENTIVKVPSKTIIIGDENTNMTRVLGHKGLFHDEQHNIDHAIIPRDATEYKIVAGSDGFWQMTCDDDIPFIVNNDSKALAEFASARWNKSWDLEEGDTTYHKLSFPKDNVDDICVAVYLIKS